jgi:two-component system, sensor histidine kinase LadS
MELRACSLLSPIFLLCAFTAFQSINAESAPPALELSQTLDFASLGRSLEYRRDDTGRLTLEQIEQTSDGWLRSDKEFPGFGFTRATYWVRLRLFNPDSQLREWRLEQGYPLIDSIKLYERRGDQRIERAAGDAMPFDARELSHRNFVFSIQTPPGETVMYLRYETASSMNIHLRLWRPDAFLEAVYAEQIALGLYYGIILVMILYNFFLFLSLRDLSYLYYVFSIAGYALYQLTLNGLSYQYLWPNAVWWGNVALPFFMFAGVAGAKLFSRSLLNTAQYAPRLDRILIGLMALTGALAPISLFLPYRIGIIAAALLVLISVVFMAAAGVVTALAGYRPARYYLVAWSMLLLGVLVYVLKTFAILPDNFFTNWSQQIGSALEVILLSLALGARITLLREANEKGQRDLIAKQQEMLELQKNLAGAFARFVPQQFLSFLERDSILDVRLGDQVQKEMTILFADIRSFTELSERLSPAENFNFLNSYLNRVGPIVRQNGGFIDKFIGDAIMALFPNSPDDAVRSAIQLQTAIREYNRERTRGDHEPIRVGVGLHTGNLILGTIGEDERMDTTVISDAVNLAARIEALTKRVGASILISEGSLFQLENPNAYRFRMLGRVRVKGKKNSVSVFEIYDGLSDYLVEFMTQTRAEFEQGVSAYYSREFALAEARFLSVLAQNPADSAAQLYATASRRALRLATVSGASA